jgi:subtilisin family serine protease
VDSPIKVYSKSPKEDDDAPIFTLPPYRVEAVFTSMAETIDWGIKLVGVPNLWRHTKGEGIKVAVLDTGIALEHPDLRDSIADAKDFTKSKSGPSDVAGHGTHVAGTIAARENSSGVIGAAPKCKLIIGKVLGDNGSGSAKSVSQGVYYAIDKGADIISMSLGSSSSSAMIHNSIKAAVKAGIFVVVAAGNEGPKIGTVGYPGRYDETITVGAIDSNKRIAKFSSRGTSVTIAAPGKDILSTYPPKGLAKLSGTSMATPLVSGIVALMLSKHNQFGSKTPIKSQKDLEQHLKDTAIDLGPDGWDPSYGHGLINPARLLAPKCVAGEDGSTSSSISLNVSKDDFSEAGRAKLADFLNGINDADQVEIRLVVK